MSKTQFDRKKQAVSAVIEGLELRRMLSASLPDPTGFPLYTASPAGGTLADGATTPPASAFTPAQIKSAYGISSTKLNGIVGDGSGQTIAIVTAFDDPAFVDSSSASFAGSDLHRFDQQFGLPDPPSFTKVKQSANLGSDAGWSEETSLDVEWTHAIAPAAKIVLVEASGAGAVQVLDWGVSTAAHYANVSVVTTSFGFGEFSGESSYDAFFTTPAGHGGVTFVASTGDTGVPGIYPAFSPNVVAVGGTHLSLSGSNYSSESGYGGSGGGASSYESKPSYQSNLTQSFSSRLTPDVSFDGDPNTGVAVYDSNNGGFPGWYKIAGTSFSAPAWAGLIAIANQGRAGAKLSPLDGPSQTLPKLYSIPSTDFHDITSGYNGFMAGSGYDLVTGRGTPIANLLLPDLAGVPAGSTGNSASISGTVFNDTNSNGKLDSGETGLSGKIYLDINRNGVLDSGEPSYPTASNGVFKFNGIPSGTYQLREIIPSGYQLTTTNTGYILVTLASGAAVTGVNFGNAKITSTTNTAAVSGTVYTDTNSNGKLDTGEVALAGVTLYIDSNKNGVLDSGETTYVTASTGTYTFGNLPAGAIQIRQVLPTGYKLTNPITGLYSITLAAGQKVTGDNFGNTRVTIAKSIGSLSGFLYIDANANGKLDSGEKPLAGVTMFLDTNKNGKLDSGETFTTTDSTGYYYFGVASAGVFRVVEVKPSGYHLTNPTAGFYDIQVNGGWNVKNENWGNHL